MAATMSPVVDRGDLVWIDLNLQTGSTQAGRHPALVISPQAYNAKSRFILICPIAPRVKGYPFEVQLPPGGPIQGVVLADHVKCLDPTVRKMTRIGSAPQDIVDDVLARMAPLVN